MVCAQPGRNRWFSRTMGMPADAWRHPKMKVEVYPSFNMAEPEPHHKPSRV